MPKIVRQTLNFLEICAAAGYATDQQGKVNLPATQECAEKLANAAVAETGLDAWKPGDDTVDLTLTGPGPVWAYLVIAHALHGRTVRLTYAAPNANIVVWQHGV